MLLLKNCHFVSSLVEEYDLPEGDVIVDGKKIVRIAPCGTLSAENAQILDLNGKTLLPGLIDMHVHLFMQAYEDVMNGRELGVQPTEYTVNVIQYAQAMLDAGYTTVRDVGDNPSRPTFAVAKAVDAGRLQGPSIIPSGPILLPTYTPTTALNEDMDGPMEFRKGARRNLRSGARFIKLYGSGSLLVPSAEPGFPIIEADEIREAVKVAKMYGTYVAIHAHGATAIDMAAREGVHTIEHASMISEETLSYIEEHYEEIGLVPTLFAFNHILNEADTPNGIRARAIRDQVISSLKSAYHNHHVQIGWGTDVPYKDFVADPMTEFRLRGEFLDYGSEDMLKQATINSAKLMYMDDQIGTIKAGKMADLVVVDGDPVSNNQVMYQKPDHVIKAGQIIR